MYTSSMRSSASAGRERVYEHLVREVLVDPRAQGVYLNEQEVADAVGVSRTPVREALLVLAAEGLVELVPRRGARVPVVTGREITELMELRTLLEVHSADVVVTAGRTPVAAMTAVLDQQRALAGEDPRTSGRRFIELDREFHQVLVDAAGSALVSRTYAGLRARQVLVGVEALLRSVDRQERVCTEHGEILAALGAGDRTAAQEAIERHLAVTLDLLLRS